MIRFTCACGREFKVADEQAGRKGKCPACGAVNLVPRCSLDPKTSLGEPVDYAITENPSIASQGRLQPRRKFVLYSAMGACLCLSGLAALILVHARPHKSPATPTDVNAPKRSMVEPNPAFKATNKVGATFEEDFKRAVQHSDPSTWIAMMDLGKILSDESPESQQVDKLLRIGEVLYKQDRRTIVETITKFATEERKLGRYTACIDYLRGSLSFEPMESLLTGIPNDIEYYFDLYRTWRVRSANHKETMKNVRDFTTAYWERINNPVGPEAKDESQ